MPSPDAVPFTLSESDAHMSHQNTQQVIESIMQVIAHLLKGLQAQSEEEDPQANENGERVISLPELADPLMIEPVNIQEQTSLLTGADPNLLSPAPAYQLEGQEPQALLPGRAIEQIELLPVAVMVQVGEAMVVGSVIGDDGSDLSQALAQFSSEQLGHLQQAIERSAQADTIIGVESEPVRIDGWIENEQGQVEYFSLVSQGQEAERAPTEIAADQQESLTRSLEMAGYESYEKFL